MISNVGSQLINSWKEKFRPAWEYNAIDQNLLSYIAISPFQTLHILLQVIHVHLPGCIREIRKPRRKSYTRSRNELKYSFELVQ